MYNKGSLIFSFDRCTFTTTMGFERVFPHLSISDMILCLGRLHTSLNRWCFPSGVLCSLMQRTVSQHRSRFFVFVFTRWTTKWLFLFFLCVGNVWCQVTNACQGGKTTNATLIRTVRCSLPHPTQILSIQTQSKSIKFEDHHLCTFSANYCRLKSGLCHLFSSFWKLEVWLRSNRLPQRRFYSNL